MNIADENKLDFAPFSGLPVPALISRRKTLAQVGVLDTLRAEPAQIAVSGAVVSIIRPAGPLQVASAALIRPIGLVRARGP